MRRFWLMVVGIAVWMAGEWVQAQVNTAVETAKVVSQSLNKTVTIPGDLVPYQAVNLSARVSGFVESVAVDRGTWVKRGQVLARADRVQEGALLVGRGLGGDHRRPHGVHPEAQAGGGTAGAQQLAHLGQPQKPQPDPAQALGDHQPAQPRPLQRAQVLFGPMAFIHVQGVSGDHLLRDRFDPREHFFGEETRHGRN